MSYVVDNSHFEAFSFSFDTILGASLFSSMTRPVRYAGFSLFLTSNIFTTALDILNRLPGSPDLSCDAEISVIPSASSFVKFLNLAGNGSKSSLTVFP